MALTLQHCEQIFAHASSAFSLLRPHDSSLITCHHNFNDKSLSQVLVSVLAGYDRNLNPKKEIKRPKLANYPA
jgi:hypothetical protein